MNLKKITLGICLVGVALGAIGFATGNDRLATGGILLAMSFGMLRAMLDVDRMF